MQRLTFAALVLIVALAPACNNGSVTPADPSSLPDPSKPVLPSTPANETFQGTITDLSGTNFHFFTTTATGTVYISVPSTTPTVALQVGLGSPAGSGCSLALLATASPSSTTVALQQVSEPPGNYCIAVEDQFRLAPFSYTVHVWHQ